MNIDPQEIQRSVSQDLHDDVGTGDISAALIEKDKIAGATLISREAAVVCGIAWADEVYRQVDACVKIQWLVKEGDKVTPGQTWAHLMGPARSLLTGERCALNWLQCLSGTATLTRQYVEQIKETSTQLLDTRKTLPGLRLAQKYAVTVGGGHNHRLGLYDAFLIKENHIAACGSITRAVKQTRHLANDKLLEVEVENLEQLKEALSCSVERILLDNFDLEGMKAAVAINQGQAKLEVSGSVNLDNLRAIAMTGVDFISVGALTKNVKAIDLSLRFLSHL